MPLDTLVTGRVATFAGPSGFGWVEAIGIKDGTVAFAGSAVDLESRADPHTRRVELEPGEIALPGIIDGHLHLVDAALEARRLDLAAGATLEDGLAAVRAAAAALDAAASSTGEPAWIEGAGWDPNRWGRWPTAADLEGVAPGRLVALWSFDHHALWVSDAALAAAGVSASEPSTLPAGGSIRQDEADRPTGVLQETATRLVSRLIPPPDEAVVEASVQALARSLLGMGVVGVHDPGALVPGRSLWFHRLLVRLAERDDLPIRVHAGVRADALQAAADAGWRSGARLTPEDAPDRVRFGWLKLFADGTLGSRTAALLGPVEGETGPDARGRFVTAPGELAELATRAAAAGIATQIHAIGDAAIRASLDALAPTAASVPVMPRLEHVQLCDAEDRVRFAAAHVGASVQPVHLREDAATARRDWGERAERDGYAWRSLLDAGAVLAFGTDAPVEPIDPWPGIAMAVLRRWPGWPNGEPAFGPEQALTLEQALRAATLGPATIAREHKRGRLVPGSAADLIVLPAAPGTTARHASADEATTSEAEAFAAVRPRLVVVDGEVVLER